MPAAGRNDQAELSGDELEVAITEVEQIVIEGMSEAPIARDTLEQLQVGLPSLTQGECSKAAVVAGQTAARLGYLSRAAESAMFEGDLDPDADLHQTLASWLAEAEKDGLSSGDAMADLAATMASSESVDPSAKEGGPTWTLPGFDGQVRGRLRDNLLLRMQCPPDLLVDDFKRTWKYGYFLCALDELCED